jgi:hypothetical protein
MKAKDLILIALICANVSLAAVALSQYIAKSEPAAVAATSSRAGDYVMVSGPVSANREAVLVIDVIAKRANLYVPKAGTTVAGTAWDLTSSTNLVTDFGVK